MSPATKFQLKLIILVFWTKFAQKRYFRSKTENVNITIEFCLFELVSVIKFHLQLTILTFWTNFAQEQYFQSKTKKENSIIEFCIFELD